MVGIDSTPPEPKEDGMSTSGTVDTLVMTGKGGIGLPVEDSDGIVSTNRSGWSNADKQETNTDSKRSMGSIVGNTIWKGRLGSVTGEGSISSGGPGTILLCGNAAISSAQGLA